MGAWSYGPYKSITRAYDDSRLGAALIAIKKELLYNGFGDSLIVETPVFGEAAANRVRDFQAARGLKVDGQVGQATARELFRKRARMFETLYNFPVGTLGNLVTLESAWDPVAVGYADPDDHGLVQINLRIHTDVTVDQAFDPSFAIGWAAHYIQSSKDRIIDEADVAKAARASYNVGVEYAKRWMNSGFAATGGVFDSTGIDWFARATNYINLIDKQIW